MLQHVAVLSYTDTSPCNLQVPTHGNPTLIHRIKTRGPCLNPVLVHILTSSRPHCPCQEEERAHIKVSLTLPMTFLLHLPFYYCVNPPLHLASEGDMVKSRDRHVTIRQFATGARPLFRQRYRAAAPGPSLPWLDFPAGTASSRNRLSSAPGAASQRRRVPGKILPGHPPPPTYTSSTNVSEKFSFRVSTRKSFGMSPEKMGNILSNRSCCADVASRGKLWAAAQTGPLVLV
jgi:hypothetical protein